jgi:hypothetical protein
LAPRITATETLLNDDDRNQRARGINPCTPDFTWHDAVVVYTDKVISEGMKAGIRLAEFHGKPIEMRSISGGRTIQRN